MKVLVLCYEYPPIGGGGGRVAQSVAQALVARGHQVRVQTAGMSHLPAWDARAGVEIFRTPSFRRREDTCAVHEMGLYVATSFLPTMRHVRRWKPDVIHAHFAVPTGALAWAVHKLTGVPYVLTAHLGDVPGGVPTQTDRLFAAVAPIAKRIWADAAGCTAVSSFVQELGQRAYGRPIERILNGIDLVGATPHPPNRVGQPVHLVFVGRFNAQKNAPFLIDSLARIGDLPWTLTMIGDGPDMEAVRLRIAAHHLSARVCLRGWLGASEVEGILRTGDILCMPSTSEGMPVAAVEALKHGLAIVASDIPGVRDVLTDAINGRTAPLNDLGAFAARLRELLTDTDKLIRMKAASWTKASEFNLEAIARQYEAMLSATSGVGCTADKNISVDQLQ